MAHEYFYVIKVSEKNQSLGALLKPQGPVLLE